MYARVAPEGYGTVVAMWNFAYDAGMGVGAVGFGLLAAGLGYPLSFACTAALMLTALVPALRDRTPATTSPGSAPVPKAAREPDHLDKP
uniref:hypothetical protein n=1 Tax=Streptomyces polyasparticus TaxID=2767826 RepID=UPI001F3D3A79|nr:hypothetical protein [Streptomyces polyasparticus]